ncbi:MAG: hypothetical protein ACM3JJ_13840 [Hyphomicrobiales bacterium]
MTRRRGRGRDELDRWIENGEEVTALFDCALRGVEQGNRTLAQQTVIELMGHLDPKGREAGGRVLAHFDSCLARIEQGAFEEAMELLLDLKDSWVEALAALRRDRQRASNVH